MLYGMKQLLRNVQVDPVSGCWLYIRWRKADGYAHITRNYKVIYAHRYVYEQLIGPIPEGMTIDHVCHTMECPTPGKLCPHRRCCNPMHLQLATGKENTLRSQGPAAMNSIKQVCPKGHPYDEKNTCFRNKRRYCRTCARLKTRMIRERKKAAASPDNPNAL